MFQNNEYSSVNELANTKTEKEIEKKKEWLTIAGKNFE